MKTQAAIGRIFFSAILLTSLLSAQGCSGEEPTKTRLSEVSNEAPDPVPEAVDSEAETVPESRDAGIAKPATTATSVKHSLPDDHWLARYAGLELDETFEVVAKGIRYEPYGGVQRGGEGTLHARSGNSLDQSILLTEILRYQGYRVRFVSGTLDGDNLAVALRGLYPPAVPDLRLEPDFAPYDPDKDPALRAARDHFWVEVYQPGEWLPLDPSFPRAQPGEAYAVASARYDNIPSSLYQRLTIALWQELHDGTKSKLGSLDEAVVTIGLKPMSLIIHRTPKLAVEDGKKSGGTASSFGGLGGGLTGSRPKAPEEEIEPEPVAVEHQPQLYVGEGFRPWQSTLIAEQERTGFIKREWLELEVFVPGSPPVRTTRDLYRFQPGGPSEPPAVRHYAIAVVPGPVSGDWLEEERTRIAATVDLNQWQRDLRRAAQVEPGSRAATAAAQTLRGYGDLAGIGAGHLVGLTFAVASDEMSRQVAWSNGVEVIWPLPRILITSIETEIVDGGGTESYVTLDLRLDRVQSVSWPGFPSRAAKLFQTARGLQNTVLESSVLSLATGIEIPVTTAILMIKAADDGTSLLTIGPANADSITQLDGLPPHSAELITAALRQGHDIIVPQRAARLGNRDRWGWWQVNRDTGEIIGVMDDGQHQASTNYTFNLSKVGLDDDMGFAIGAIIGADSTLFTISGLMLKYGETSPQMIAEVEKYVKSIMCRSCPSGAGVSAGASGSASAGNDCMKIEKKFEAQIGASAKIGFCESYQAGFACASGLLLSGLTGSGAASASYGGQVGVDVQVNCEHAFGGLKVDDTGYTTNGPNTIRN